MQTASYRNWTQDAMFISVEDDPYNTFNIFQEYS